MRYKGTPLFSGENRLAPERNPSPSYFVLRGGTLSGTMQSHHYLGDLPKIGETHWYVATWHDEWVALLTFSAAALKCAVRDQWIGWDFRHQYDRLKLVANNSRYPNIWIFLVC